MSKDAVAVASLVGSVLILRLTFTSSAERIEQFMAYCIAMAKNPSDGLPPMEILMQSILLIARVAGPLLGVTILLTLVATMAQTRMLVSSNWSSRNSTRSIRSTASRISFPSRAWWRF